MLYLLDTLLNKNISAILKDKTKYNIIGSNTNMVAHNRLFELNNSSVRIFFLIKK